MRRLSFSLLGLCLCLSACGSQLPEATQKLPVTASFYPLAYLLQSIGGDGVEVQMITPAGVEPHEYEPTAQELQLVYGSRLFLMNGAGVDPWAERVRGELESKNVKTIEAVEIVNPLSTAEEVTKEGEGDEHGHEESGLDPHFWHDPERMVLLAQAIEKELIQLLPDQESAIRERSAALVAELKILDQEFSSGLAQCTHREVVTAHNAFAYLAHRYQLTMYPIAGFSPEDDPSLARVQELQQLVESKGLTTVFFETLANPKIAETLAQEAGIRTDVLNPIEGLLPEEAAQNVTYLTLMRQNLSALRQSLQCQ